LISAFNSGISPSIIWLLSTKVLYHQHSVLHNIVQFMLSKHPYLLFKLISFTHLRKWRSLQVRQ
jgi:hypothetical protein